MANRVQHKRSNVAATVPTAAQVAVGELAINFVDKKIYTQEPGGTVIELAGDSKWTSTGSDIYRNSSVAIGSTTAPATNSKLDVSGTACQNAVAMAANDMDLSLGQVFTKTISAAVSLSIINPPASRSATAVLHLLNGGTAAITWNSAIKWPSGTAPTLTSAGLDVLVFHTVDGGATWRGNIFGKDVK